MQTTYAFSIKQLLTALCMTLCIISLAVILTLNFRPLYYFDIDYFHLEENTGYSEEIIRSNYDALRIRISRNTVSRLMDKCYGNIAFDFSSTHIYRRLTLQNLLWV